MAPQHQINTLVMQGCKRKHIAFCLALRLPVLSTQPQAELRNGLLPAACRRDRKGIAETKPRGPSLRHATGRPPTAIHMQRIRMIAHAVLINIRNGDCAMGGHTHARFLSLCNSTDNSHSGGGSADTALPAQHSKKKLPRTSNNADTERCYMSASDAVSITVTMASVARQNSSSSVAAMAICSFTLPQRRCAAG